MKTVLFAALVKYVTIVKVIRNVLLIFNMRFCPVFSCQDTDPHLGSSTLTSLWQRAIKSAVAMFSNRRRYETRLKRSDSLGDWSQTVTADRTW